MGKLSGGQKKKVLLACSLFCDLDLLLLDGTCTVCKHSEY
jgi:ABC-type Mn2+/Zn2+ transport system ATPase subunit